MAYTMGSVQMVADVARNFSGYGFVIQDEHNRRCVTFAYETRKEAEAAGVLMLGALKRAMRIVAGSAGADHTLIESATSSAGA